jgi:peptidoglycan/xylan/chitin deacetylase (PgdA/CDA1 family)
MTPVYSEKVIILNFDDDWKGQYLNVKPILEKYGFRATFFLTCDCVTYQNSSVCNNAANPNSVLTWEEVKSLQKAGHDLQSHGMTHKDLTSLSNDSLENEIGQSKQCLLDHNINSTIFANAFGSGADNATVIKVVSKYYDMARAGYDPLTFLKCDGWAEISNQTDCSTFFDNGTLTLANRYSLRIGNHNYFDSEYSHNSTEIFPQFVKAINDQSQYNTDGAINAIPIVTYHNVEKVENNSSIVNSNYSLIRPIPFFPYLTYNDLRNIENSSTIVSSNWINSTTDVNLLEREMRYLYENGFKVLTMSDLGYNTTSNEIYIK